MGLKLWTLTIVILINSQQGQLNLIRGSHICFLISHKETNLVEDVEFLLLLSFVEFHSAVSEKMSKTSWPIIGRAAILVFQSAPKNTNLVKEVEILLPVKFHWILFSSLRGKVRNVSAIQRPGQPSWFPIGPKNRNMVKDVEILLPVKFIEINFHSAVSEEKLKMWKVNDRQTKDGRATDEWSQ